MAGGRRHICSRPCRSTTARSGRAGRSMTRASARDRCPSRPQRRFIVVAWLALDSADRDLGGSGPLLLRVVGATPAQLIIALGKDGQAYLIDQARMGGIGGAIARQRVSRSSIINAAAAYATARGTYVAFKGSGIGCPGGLPGSLTVIHIGAISPPTVRVAWCADQRGSGSPIATTTDGRSGPIVWSVGAEGDNRLRGFDGDTGQVVFDGGGAGDGMTRVRRFRTPMVPKGRIFVAAEDRVYPFKVR